MSNFLEAAKNIFKEIQQGQLQKQESLRLREEDYKTIKDYIVNPHIDASRTPDPRKPTRHTHVVRSRIYLIRDDLRIFPDEIQARIDETANPIVILSLSSTSDDISSNGIRILFSENRTERSPLSYKNEDRQFALLPTGHVLSKFDKHGKLVYQKENPPDTGVFGVVAKAIKEQRLYPNIY